MNFKSLSASCLLGATIISGFASLAQAENEKNTNNDYFVQFNLGGSITNSKTIEFQVDNKVYSGTGNIPSGLIGLEGGVNVNENIRLSLSADYRPVYPFDVKDCGTKIGSLDAYSFSSMINGYYDFHNSSNFTPYLTAGLGFAQNHTKIDQENNGLSVNKKTTDNFAYKLGLGSKYSINQNFDFDIRYQFVDLGKYKFSDTATLYGVQYPVQGSKSVSMQVHELLIGLAYKF